MASSIVSKDHVAQQREDMLSELTSERVRLASALEKVKVEVVDARSALLEARDEVATLEWRLD